MKKYGDERSSSDRLVAETRVEDNDLETLESIKRQATQSEIDRRREEDISGTE